MKYFFNKILIIFLNPKSSFSIVLSVLASVFLVTVFVFAASTIDLNISTGGDLAVSGTSATSTFSTGGLTVGTSQFVVQQSSGRVGIGTTSPLSKFHVTNGPSGSTTPPTNTALLIEDDDSAYLSFLTPSSAESGIFFGNTINNSHGAIVYNNTTFTPDGFQFRTAGNSIKMVIDSSGNVGVGTTSPSTNFAVVGDTYFTGGLGVGTRETTDGNITVSGNATISGNAAVSGTLTVSATSTFAGVSSGFISSSNNLQAAGILKITGSGTSTIAGNFEVTGKLLAEGGQRVCTSGNSICSGTGTINSGTVNRLSYYSGATTLDSANGLIIDAANGSTTVSRILYATNFYATSTAATSTFKGGLIAAIGGGNVGIGTANPGQMLELATGNILLDRHPTSGDLNRSEYIGISDISGLFADDPAG